VNISKYGLLLGLLIIMVVASIFGGHFGYSVSGVPHGWEAAQAGSSWWGNVLEFWGFGAVMDVVAFTLESINFMFNMALFRIDNMPAFISVIFLVMSLMTAYLIVNLVRGT